MPRGGARPNSGPKKGYKRTHTDALVKRAEELGIMPLEYLLEVMRDKRNDQAVRIDAAKAAAPYVHAKKLEHSGHVTQETWIVNAGEAISELDAEAWRNQAIQH